MSVKVADVPQWKKDLIARLRHQNKKVAAIVNGDEHHQQYNNSSSCVQQPKPKPKSDSVESGAPEAKHVSVNSKSTSRSTEPLAEDFSIMVQQERNNHEHLVEMVTNGYHKDADSDSEDLHYGPGIVKKLKNKYLSLALRETVTRPSILQLRKATSLENLLDEDTRQADNKLFESKLNGSDNRRNHQNNRYRHAKGREIKRARSVETISRTDSDIPAPPLDDVRSNRQSLHEEMLIAEGNRHPSHFSTGKTTTDSENGENEKFSPRFGRGRTNRPKRIQPMMSDKEKPPPNVVRQAKMIFEKRPEQRTRAPAHTGDVAAKVDSFNTIIVKAKVAKKPPPVKTKPALNDKFFQKLVTEKPPKTLDLNKPIKLDFKELPSPIPDVSRIEKEAGKLCETPDLILTSSPVPALKEIHDNGETRASPRKLAGPLPKPTPGEHKRATEVFNFANKTFENVPPASEQLNVDVEASGNRAAEKVPSHTREKSNASVVNSNSDGDKSADRVKRKNSRAESSNTSVFNFTDRKDVPDYISNDLSRSPGRPELPKPGEGGIILIPGATILESFTDEDEEILKSLEGPPSPCDVTFINDNVLIDGKSSLSQKTTKPAKLRISFLDGPEVYEYPSETSLMVEEDPSQSHVVQVGHTVPILGGSSLANYTPKTTEEFHPGISRTTQPAPTTASDSDTDDHNHRVIEETAKPFSSGHNADMLF